MNGFFRPIFFYFLEFVSAVLNLLASLVGYYPGFELGIFFLVSSFKPTFDSENEGQTSRREEKMSEAVSIAAQAKDYGKNI